MERRCLSGVATLALCGLLVSAPAAGARASAGGAPALIAFDRTVDGVGRVAIARTSGGPARILTPAAGNEGPVWSHDGREIAYVNAFDLSSSDVVVSPLRTGRARRLTDTAGLDAYPAWSPRGSSIAWTHDEAGRLSIWTMTGAGTHKRRLTHGRHDGDPEWSPDGSRIAFLDLATGALALVDSRGRHQRRLAAPKAATGSTAPTWSPDGRQIAFSGLDGALYAVRVDGSGARALTRRSPAPFAWRPQWSPRGDEIAYLDQARHGALVTLDPRTRRTRVLAKESDGLSAPSWSPDGRMIAFATRSKHIAIVAADGGFRRTITHAGADDADPAWQP